MRAIGLHIVYQLGLQMQEHVGDPVATLYDYGRRFLEVAARTLQRARLDQGLGHDLDYVELRQYQRGRGVARGGGARRG